MHTEWEWEYSKFWELSDAVNRIVDSHWVKMCIPLSQMLVVRCSDICGRFWESCVPLVLVCTSNAWIMILLGINLPAIVIVRRRNVVSPLLVCLTFRWVAGQRMIHVHLVNRPVSLTDRITQVYHNYYANRWRMSVSEMPLAKRPYCRLNYRTNRVREF